MGARWFLWPEIPDETKTSLERFLASMLQKSGKLRSLIRDLRESYASCDSTTATLSVCFYMFWSCNMNQAWIHLASDFWYCWVRALLAYMSYITLPVSFFTFEACTHWLANPLSDTQSAWGMWNLCKRAWRRWTQHMMFATKLCRLGKFTISRASY
jgi:hypothetical protein